MRRPITFVQSVGFVRCRLPSGQAIRVPVVPGILKHPTVGQLNRLLKDSDVVRKYTREALRRAPWPVLRQFPREWLEACLPEAGLRPGRASALKYMLA